jgi:hypothetical protein
MLILTVISLTGDPGHVGHVELLSGYIPSFLVAGIGIEVIYRILY